METNQTDDRQSKIEAARQTEKGRDIFDAAKTTFAQDVGLLQFGVIEKITEIESRHRCAVASESYDATIDYWKELNKLALSKNCSAITDMTTSIENPSDENCAFIYRRHQGAKKKIDELGRALTECPVEFAPKRTLQDLTK